MKHLKQLIADKESEMKAYALRLWNVEINFSVDYNITSSRTLGTYSKLTNTINLNQSLLLEFGELYINDVFVHEVCHCIIDTKYPSGYNGRGRVMPHGREFKAVCSHFGNDGKSTTTLFKGSETIAKAKAKSGRSNYEHSCNCMTHNVGIKRHNKINEGAKYICRNCKTALQPNEQMQVA